MSLQPTVGTVTTGTWKLPGVLGQMGLTYPDIGLTESYAPALGVNPNQPVTIPSTGSNPETSRMGELLKTPVNTNPNPNPAPTSKPANNFDSVYSQFYQGWDKNSAYQDYLANPNKFSGQTDQNSINQERDRIMSEISGGYDSYLNQLTSTLENDLPVQLGNQNQIVQNNLDTGLQNLDLQKQSGEFDLSKESATNVSNQVKTLKDVSTNIRNLMSAGNTYLGGKGAGDSSAVNQYTYALTKLGSKQRGDVMAQSRNIEADIQARKWKLTNAYNQEVNKLRNETSNKALEVSNWFNEQQNNLRLMIAQGKLNKSTEIANLSKSILQESMNRLALAQQEQANKTSQLKTWVLNNSTSIAQATTMWNQITASKNQQIQNNPINGNIAMNGLSTQMPKYGGYSGYDDEDSLF